MTMNRMFAVVEKFIVDPKELISAPGQFIRLRGHEETDIRKVFSPIDIPDVSLSAYKESFEIERQIQEVTAANRVTTGTAGLVNDQNKTLGGMQLLRQAAFDRFVVYAYIIGKTFMVKAAKMFNELIYQNISDESVKAVLGQQPIEMLPGQLVAKYQTWKRLPPHEVERDYDFVPVDVFSMENKQDQATQLLNFEQMVAQLLPQHNPRPTLMKAGKLMGLSSEEVLQVLGPDTGPVQNPMQESGKGLASLPRSSPPKNGSKSSTGTPPLGAAGGLGA